MATGRLGASTISADRAPSTVTDVTSQMPGGGVATSASSQSIAPATPTATTPTVRGGVRVDVDVAVAGCWHCKGEVLGEFLSRVIEVEGLNC